MARKSAKALAEEQAAKDKAAQAALAVFFKEVEPLDIACEQAVAQARAVRDKGRAAAERCFLQAIAKTPGKKQGE